MFGKFWVSAGYVFLKVFGKFPHLSRCRGPGPVRGLDPRPGRRAWPAVGSVELGAELGTWARERWVGAWELGLLRGNWSRPLERWGRACWGAGAESAGADTRLGLGGKKRVRSGGCTAVACNKGPGVSKS